MLSCYRLKISNEFLHQIDGQRSIGEIFEAIRATGITQASNEELLDDIRDVYETLIPFFVLLLRHKSTKQWPW